MRQSALDRELDRELAEMEQERDQLTFAIARLKKVRAGEPSAAAPRSRPKAVKPAAATATTTKTA